MNKGQASLALFSMNVEPSNLLVPPPSECGSQ